MQFNTTFWVTRLTMHYANLQCMSSELCLWRALPSLCNSGFKRKSSGLFEEKIQEDYLKNTK